MDDIEWNVVNESRLLEAMVGHKPVGVNKFFQMAFICDKLSDNLHKDISSKKIWSHLETMYNLEALDESESLPFPNDEKDFMLPDSEYGVLKQKKEEKLEEKKTPAKGRETPKVKDVKKEEKTGRNGNGNKEIQRRDSKDSKEGRPSFNSKEDARSKNKTEETPRANKRPTRGSMKPDDNGSNGKASPVTVTPSSAKRRRL